MSEIASLLFKTTKQILKNYYTYVTLLLLLATYFTVTPFLYHTFQTPKNRIYIGTEGNVKTYFKYLKTTLVGQNLSFADFKKVFSQSPLDEKYYLLSGRLSAIFALSHFSSYHFGRLTENFLLFLFLYLSLSQIFKNSYLRLFTFSLISLVLLPFHGYPHQVFIRFLLTLFLFVLLKLLKRLNILNAFPLALGKTPAVILTVLTLLLGSFLNQRYLTSVKNQFGSGKTLSPLIYPSKDFYEGVGYLRDNVSANEKVICLSRCSILTEVFAGIPTVLGLPENDAKYKEDEQKVYEDIKGIFDDRKILTRLKEGNVTYWFIGPEEKPISIDLTRLRPQEVFKNKEVVIYKLQ